MKELRKLTLSAALLLIALPAVRAATVSTPAFSPSGGTFTAPQTVTLSTATAGASINYTTDGSAPSDTAGTLYTAPITVSVTTTIKAVAYMTGLADSAVSTAKYTIKALAPTFSPSGGTFTAPQTVTLSTATAGASINYTTDGSTPSDTAGMLYSGPIAVNVTTTIKAVAYLSGLANSTVSTATYTIRAIAPAFSPSGGTYTAPQTVTLNTATSGASINYTTDGSTPSNTAGTLYTGPITVSVTTTIKAVAYMTGLADSAVSTAKYTIKVLPPTFSPSGGTFTTPQTVTLSTTTAGASINYTTDGSTPSATAGTLYAGPITVSVTTTIKAVAYMSGLTDSAVSTATYTIRAIAPAFSPLGGTFTAPQTVTLSTATAGASINYTTDGSTPSDTAGTLYTGPITVSATTTIKAVAYMTGLADSAVSTAKYTIKALAPAFSPSGGTFTAPQTVTLSTATPGASINYTTDGSTPSGTAGTLYTSPITVSVTTTIKAVAYMTGLADSAVSTAKYTIRAIAPAFSPSGGTFTAPQTVTLSTATAGASINYTIDGSAPSATAGTLYTGPITVNTTTTIKAVAYMTGLADSAVSTAKYTFHGPSISILSPASGPVGTSITISGSNFGASQGASTVTFNGVSAGAAYRWSASSIMAAIPTGAATGNVVVTVNGLASNGAPFTVTLPPSISSVSPASAAPGAAVTIGGSNFGAAQSSGQVWLGTANGVVQSWSDTQVVALVAIGSASGNAQILQNGVWSNAVPFTVNTLHIAGVSPASVSPGATVTITGTGFGASQGNGAVWLGGTAGQVVSWSDTQIVAVVAPTALTGVARIQQNGVWSNAVAFTVPAPNGNTLVPNLLNLVVGDTHTIQALNAAGQPVTGLTWASSDPTVVSLSSGDPPLLTALAAGHVTITAGTASADVTVSSGPLPLGTVLWSNPGDGSGITQIVPAVPSPSGVADVFAFQADGTVAAITADGTTAWTADVNQGCPSGWNCIFNLIPDFQGGLVGFLRNLSAGAGLFVARWDGITGQRYALYTPDPSTWALSSYMAAYPDGTILTFPGGSNECSTWGPPCVPADAVGIDPATGAQKFSVPLAMGSQFSTFAEFPPVIAGDGYAYEPYVYGGTIPGDLTMHLALLRVNSSGESDAIEITSWPGWAGPDLATDCGIDGVVNMITNADTGVLLSWVLRCEQPVTTQTQYMAITTGASVSMTSAPAQPGGSIVPVLQAQDGSFVGAVPIPQPPCTSCPTPEARRGPSARIAGPHPGSSGLGPMPRAQRGSLPRDASAGDQYDMIAFDATGNVRWSVPNDQPQIATADGGVIGQSGIIYDQNGNATGQIPGPPTQSWGGNTYQLGSVERVNAAAIPMALSLWANAGGNPSGNGTAARPWYFILSFENNFTLTPDNPNVLLNLTTDISNDAALIKRTAVQEFQDAYSGNGQSVTYNGQQVRFPVQVREGANDPTHADVLVHVLDHSTGSAGDCGYTTTPNAANGKWNVEADYTLVMEQAQDAYNVVINNAQDESAVLASRLDLIQAIGRAIGATAAHEAAHTFLWNCCDMDNLPENDPNSEGTFNAGGCEAKTDPSFWTGYWPSNPPIFLHWEQPALTALQQCLNGGWHEKPGSSCHN